MYQIEILLYLIITSAILATLFIILMVAIGSIQQRHKTALHRLNVLTEISLLEKERAHMATELHEEFGSSFSYLKMNMSQINIIRTDPEQLQQTTEHIDEMVKKVRDLTFELLPPTFQHFGLEAALHNLIDKIDTEGGPQIRLEITDGLPKLRNDKALTLYRIIQEIIANTLQHARATLLHIEIKKEHDQLLLISRDNGVGFNYKKALREETGFGLKSIINRTDVMGGTAEVLSRKGKGTIYLILFPL